MVLLQRLDQCVDIRYASIQIFQLFAILGWINRSCKTFLRSHMGHLYQDS